MRRRAAGSVRLRADAGFTIVEMLVAMTIMMIVTGGIFQMAGSSQSGFRTQPEVADMQQRLRLAADMIYRDLLMAGAGFDRGPATGPLSNFLPPLRPARRGASSPDGDLTHNPSRIDILYVPRTRSQTSLLVAQAAAGSDLTLNTLQAGCEVGTPCGFAAGTRALLVDTSAVGAGYEVFTVTGTTPLTLAHSAPNLAFSKAYPANSTMVAQVEEHVYALDPQTHQLKHYDGHQGDEVLVDDVSDLRFTYFADPDPMSAPRPAAGLSNCVYDVGDLPKLDNLGGTTLKALTPAQLTDGPICGIGNNRFDGDLLRVRKVRVSIRVRPSRAELRAGDAKLASQLVPDYTVNFEVAPRNLNLIR